MRIEIRKFSEKDFYITMSNFFPLIPSNNPLDHLMQCKIRTLLIFADTLCNTYCINLYKIDLDKLPLFTIFRHESIEEFCN